MLGNNTVPLWICQVRYIRYVRYESYIRYTRHIRYARYTRYIRHIRYARYIRYIRCICICICQVRDSRAIGSIYFTWDEAAQATVGSTTCLNSGVGSPCTPVGYLQHWGRAGLGLNASLPLTLNGEIVGPLGGFGWCLAGTRRYVRYVRYVH